MNRLRCAATLATATLSVAALGSTTPGFAQDPILSNETGLTPTIAFVPLTPDETVIISPRPDAARPVAGLTRNAEYRSLAHAVGSQDDAALDRELNCLAAGVFFESHGEPLAGQLAVAETILNRTRSGRFANSICGVLKQRGQFSFVRRGVVPRAEGRSGWKTAVAVAKVALRDLWQSPAGDALYFHARRVAPAWRATRIAAIGNHIFYR